MRALNLLLLTILAAPLLIDAVVVNDASAPDCSIYANGVHLPDETSCSNYYVCRNGRPLRKRCARGFSFDANIMYCNFAALVNCNRVRALATRAPDGDDNSTDVSTSTTSKVSGTTTTTCLPTTTTCTTTTTPCTTTTTPCTTTTTPCATSTTSCATTTTPCTTTTTPCTTTTTCTTTPPCSSTTTPCTATTTPCTTTTTPCTTTTTAAPARSTASTTEAPAPTLHILRSRRDCQGLLDGTALLDGKHCRRFYVCRQGRARRLRCNVGQWFDWEKGACRNSAAVTNCPAQRN